jgi:hypothetical protein
MLEARIMVARPARYFSVNLVEVTDHSLSFSNRELRHGACEAVLRGAGDSSEGVAVPLALRARSNVAYHAGLRGMYQWSAKSNVYFAQAAWWAEGQRPVQAAGDV